MIEKLVTFKMTKKQSLNKKKCPGCKSTDISYMPSGCLCRIEGHSCWHHPVCNACGYTAGPGAGNSNNGMWVSFGLHDIKWPIEISYTPCKGEE
jgi:hypothetical protein